MTFTKEQISQAFIQVLNERVPDLSNIPNHVFSERFEEKMNKLIRREAAHPWAVSHTLARNLIAAAIVIILLFTLCMSVGAIRNAIFKFFSEHFETYDIIYFETPEKEIIDQDYVITELPTGFYLIEEEISEINIRRTFGNEQGGFITINQFLSLEDGGEIDNEQSGYTAINLDGHGVYVSTATNNISLFWDQDGYVFFLVLSWDKVSVDDAITIYRSIQPTK